MVDTALALVSSAEAVLFGGLALSASIAMALFGLIAIALFVSSLISILASQRYTGGGKVLWVIGVFVFPIAGPLVWWIFGRNAKIRTDVP